MSYAQPYYLKGNDVMLNNTLPVLTYWQAIDAAKTNRASAFEQLFARNGWTHPWRDGIYSFPHYHSTAHEVLDIACDSARGLWAEMEVSRYTWKPEMLCYYKPA